MQHARGCCQVSLEIFAEPEVLMIIVWSGSLSAISFLILKKGGALRISEEVEDSGMDSHHHSPPKAYALGAANPNVE